MPLTWYRLRWPRAVTAEQVTQMFRLLASTAGTPVVVEATSAEGLVTHRLAVPEGRAGGVIHQLRAAVPGLDAEVTERSISDLNRAVELGLSTRRRPLRVDDLEGVSRAVLTALGHVGHDEALGLQWVLVRSLIPVAVPSRMDRLAHESWITGLLAAPFGSPPVDHELRAALKAKQSEPGWRLVGRLAVRAASQSRQRQLIRQVLGALRSAEAPGVGFRVRSVSPRRFIRAVVPWHVPLRLNVSELATLSAFPIGSTTALPVAAVGSRLMPPTAAICRSGLVIAESTYPGRTRPLALSATDALRHVHALGASGSGKSTLLVNIVAQAMQAGQAVVVIEPKGDLIADVLARVPERRINDVVLLSPTDERPVGLNPLAPAGRSPELVADQLLGLFHSLYASSWGVRTADILGASLLTLARLPGMTLAAVPLLLTDAGFRRRVLPKVVDPLGTTPFWAAYESWSEAERRMAIAPTLNKLRPLLMRPELRGILGQSTPRFELRQVFTQRRLLLVDLAKGQLGSETAALLGSLLISQLWQAILGRSAISPERRHPVLVVVDEFQDYVRHALVDFADALAQARGLGVGFVLAHQYMHQLDAPMRSAVMANAQSRVAFRLPNEDARIVAAGGVLDPEDFQGLGAYECYAQLVADAAIQPWCSARTLPASQPISDPAVVRAASRAAYGTPRETVEAELRGLLVQGRQASGDDLSPRRRDDRGGS